ncbi:uncharacterized protein LOC130902455 isoform X1 [Diorhabda carinulata]|uniref:uncharacterized protein LOC130902455 isoform X1 n=1 Tax=Diorhabda carinulata TaxID=1163345 RepID=UPI0025A29824|nr:uncharacterized protein LOC130902455 isoform X1 [Diorhabda carinulata]XP_057670596.1 uncharacterized protein LOC130902455 isoform X1 [Diorhabda carinulata]
MRKSFIEWLCKDNVFLVREMPLDMVSFVVSTGLGVSVVAGIISGVCYILAYGSPKKSNRRSKSNVHCDVCGEYFRSIDHILSGDNSVICWKCDKKVCQKRCASLDVQQNRWTCKNCSRPPESWFQGVLYAIQPNKKEKICEKMDEKGEIDVQKSREEVREFIEKLVNSMLGQNVDDANVTRLYNDEHYLPLTGQQSPCTAHAALKQLIEKLLQEVLSMPHLRNRQQGAADLNNKTYEDLLATAILNKVISNSQNGRPSSSAASVSSRISNSSNQKEEKEYFFGEETLNSKWRNPDLETTSISSLEDWLQSDSSFGSRKYVDKLTLTIKQDIEEVSQASDSDNDVEDDSEYFRTRSGIWSDDEPNWFLQKRAFRGTHSPVPVPMLVPKPTTDAKVLIGDKEVEETSDLSDVESEYGDTKIVPTRQNLLVNSKKIIGGKNSLENAPADGEGSESESSADSGVKEVDRGQSVYDESENTTIYTSRADISLDDDNVEDASLISTYSNTEQVAEYTEKYASLPRTIEKKPDPPARLSIQNNLNESIDNEMRLNRQQESEEKQDEEIQMVQMHFSGSYSRREKEKWKNAIDMKNNPYSKENIEKRIQRSNSGISSLFGSDYYAKMASSPSGTKSRSPEGNILSWPPSKQEKEDFIDKSPEKHISKTYISQTEETGNIFKAIPIIVEPEINRTPPISPPETTEMTSLTSDSDLSYVNIYNVENSEISKVNGLGEEKVEKSSGKFVKATNNNNKRFGNQTNLKRHKSETDLLDDNFYIPPKVLAKKKDNTLISKIYLDPQVRSFALSNRQHLPVNNLVPTFRTQLSNPEYIIDYKAYHSDDGISTNRNKKYTVYSSEEDLLSSSSIEMKNGTMIHTAKMSLSSEDDRYSERSSIYSPDQRKQIYSSSDDLLSIDEMDSHKKRDNTIISKIYQQPAVRKYALEKRKHAQQQSNLQEKIVDVEDNVFTDVSRMPKTTSTKDVDEMEIKLNEINIKENGNDCNQNGWDDKEKSPLKNEEENDPGVEEVAKRKIVHNILGKISASQTNLGKSENKEEIHTEEDITISVKDLRKKFEKLDGKNKIVSSLTARSLSKQMRENLKN